MLSVGIGYSLHNRPAYPGRGEVMRLDFCKHFNGTVNKTCGAGLALRDMAPGPDLGWVKRLPCRSTNGVDTCDKREYPTKEEVDKFEADIDALINLSVKAVAAIKAVGHPKGQDASGIIVCPKCGGELHYRIAGYNGHVWASCKTPDCLRWME